MISAKKQTSKLITFCFALTLNGWICYCTSVRSASRRIYFEIIQLMIFWIQKTEGSCGRGFLKLSIYEYASVAFKFFLEFFFFNIWDRLCLQFYDICLKFTEKPEANFSERRRSQYKCDLRKKCSSKEDERHWNSCWNNESSHPIWNIGTILHTSYTCRTSNFQIVIIDNLHVVYLSGIQLNLLGIFPLKGSLKWLLKIYSTMLFKVGLFFTPYYKICSWSWSQSSFSSIGETIPL